MMPRGARPWATSHDRDSNAWALYRDVPVRNPEMAFNDYRSVEREGAHRAGVDWVAAVHVPAVQLRWVPGFVPRRVRVGVGPEHAIEWVAEVAPGGLSTLVPVDRVTRGIAVEMPAGPGPEAWQGWLRVMSLAPVIPAPARVGVRWAGQDVWPALQLASDGDPHSHLDVSDTPELLLAFDQPTAAVELVARWVGQPPRWLSALGGPAQTEAGPVEVGFVAAPASDGLAGVQRAWLMFARPVREARVPVGLAAPYVAMLVSVRPVSDTPPTVPAALPPEVNQGGAPEHAVSFGPSGADRRGAVLPDGTALITGARRRQALWVRITGAGDGPVSRRPFRGGCVVERGGLFQTWTVDGCRVESAGSASIALTARDGWREFAWPAPLDPRFERTAYGWAAQVDLPVELRIDDTGVCLLEPGKVTPVAPAPAPDATWRGVPYVDALLDRALDFFTAEDRVPYGVFPSVYDGRVFGLEEDYLFRGLAQWGLGDLAWRGFRATYLTDAHLDPREYLHDLRYGVTPWQAWWLLRLRGQNFADLAAKDRERLLAMGRWSVAQVARTDDRPFPGLLPAYRYGGDLDFPTQSLSTNAAHVAGLRALFELTGDPTWRAASDALRQSLVHALETVARGGQVRLQTGGGDEGDYWQLMADGIFANFDTLPAEHAIMLRLDSELEQGGRRWRELPRFRAWGGEAIDPHYCVGHLRNLLHRGERARFLDGLDALLTRATDPAILSFREVTPLNQLDQAFLPGARLSQAEPCVGGVGVALQLLRDAIVTEPRGPDGWPDGRLLVLGGREPGEAVEFAGPTLFGRVEVRASGGDVEVRAPADCALILGEGWTLARSGS